MAKASKGKAGAKALIGKAAKALAKALSGKKGKAVAKAKSGKKDKAGLKDVSGKDEEKDSNDDDPKGRGKKRKAIATDKDVGASKLQGEDASSSDPKKSALALIKRVIGRGGHGSGCARPEDSKKRCCSSIDGCKHKVSDETNSLTDQTC